MKWFIPMIVVSQFTMTACAEGVPEKRRTILPLESQVASQCVEPGKSLTAVTYNAGIAPGIVPLSSPRIPAVVNEIANLDTDLMCIQEAWSPSVQRRIRSELEAKGYNVYATDTSGEGETGADKCTASEIKPAYECVSSNCQGIPEENVTMCAIKHCVPEGLRLYLFSRDCLRCAMAQPGKSLDSVRDTCINKGASRIYDGSNGVMLASRYELVSPETIRLPSSGANRVALVATLKGYTTRPIEIGCTQISTSGPMSPTNPSFDDWKDEKKAQWKMVANRLAKRARGRPILFMGDMNFEASDSYIWPTVTKTYGYTSPATLLKQPFCSACKSNLVMQSTPGTHHDRLIDHLMTTDINGVMYLQSIKRVADKPVQVRDHYGKKVTTHPSDHFGTHGTWMCQ